MDAYLEMMLTLVKFFSGLFIAYGLYTAFCAIREAPWYMNKTFSKILINAMGKKGFKIYSFAVAVVFVACGIALYFYAAPSLREVLESLKIS